MARTQGRTARAAQMRRLVEEWRRGGATQAEVARRHGVKTSTFGWWCSRLREADAAGSGFVAVDVVEGTHEVGTGFDLVLPGDVRVHVPAEFRGADLRRLIEAVRPC